MYEVQTAIADYRRDEPEDVMTNRDKYNWIADAEDRLRNELYDGLEYNEVLRARISTKCSQITGKAALPSVVYRLLGSILKDPTLKRSKEAIDAYIESEIS
jgi:hypothetical protein